MDFALTDEQRALQDAVRSYVRDRFGPDKVRAVADAPEDAGNTAAVWRGSGEQGGAAPPGPAGWGEAGGGGGGTTGRPTSAPARDPARWRGVERGSGVRLGRRVVVVDGLGPVRDVLVVVVGGGGAS